MKIFIYSVIIFVIAVVVVGFFMIGSPQTERMRQLDMQRVNHLQLLQSHIVDYWENKNVLPEKLDLLNDSLRGVSVPRDPETNAEYGYMVNGPLSFSLCATFAYSSDSANVIAQPSPARLGSYPVKTGSGISDNWEHGVGTVCFDRPIDKDFYPLTQKGAIPIQ